MKHLSTLAALGVICAGTTPSLSANDNKAIELTALSSMVADPTVIRGGKESPAEIVAHDPATQRLFVVNAVAHMIDVFDINDPASPQLAGHLDVDINHTGVVVNSVAVKDGLIAVAVEANPKTNPGRVVFFDNTMTLLSWVEVGAQPDMVTFTHNGRYVLTANEGEPSTYAIPAKAATSTTPATPAVPANDPEGSVSIIDLSGGAAQLTAANVRTADFTGFNGHSRVDLFAADHIRVFGPGATVARDLEPEYITTSHDSQTAWVTLQENNAIAIIDIPSATVTELRGLGVKDHSLVDNGFGSGNERFGNALDASDQDDQANKIQDPKKTVPALIGGPKINIQTWPVKGFYSSDAIASYKIGNQTYLVLANEGDVRDWPGYSEETTVGGVALDPAVFPIATAAKLKKPENLGRLKITAANGNTTALISGKPTPLYHQLFSFGGRSFSIRTAEGDLVWDSGDQFEQITAALDRAAVADPSLPPVLFNSSHDKNLRDGRSPSKGPEPEGVTVAKMYGREYAFIALERIGGVMVYDISSPSAPEFVQYINNRNFTKPITSVESADLGPEGLIVISEENSPNGKPLLVVANEISGTTTIFEISKTKN